MLNCVINFGWLCSSMKTLGEPDEDNSASSWVQKFDFIQQEKEKAEKRVKSNVQYLLRCVCIVYDREICNFIGTSAC